MPVVKRVPLVPVVKVRPRRPIEMLAPFKPKFSRSPGAIRTDLRKRRPISPTRRYLETVVAGVYGSLNYLNFHIVLLHGLPGHDFVIGEPAVGDVRPFTSI